MDHLRPPCGIRAGIGAEQRDLEGEKILGFRVKELPEFLGADLVREAVWVVAVGEPNDLHVAAGGQQEVDAPQGCADACGVPVVQHGDAPGEASDELDLALREGRTRRSHRMLHARLVQGHDVGVAFHQQDPVLAHDGRPREVQPVEHVALVVQRAFRAVEVLRDVLVLAQGPPAEADDPARRVPDGEHHAAPEEVVGGAVAFLRKPCGDEAVEGVAGLERRLRHGVPPFWAPADAEVGDGVIAEPAAPEVPEGYAAPFVGAVQGV